MIHIGKNTKSTIISKGISADQSSNAFRGLVDIRPKASNSRNYTQCDSMLVGTESAAHTFPYIQVANSSAKQNTKQLLVELVKTNSIILNLAALKEKMRFKRWSVVL